MIFLSGSDTLFKHRLSLPFPVAGSDRESTQILTITRMNVCTL